jgi:hypothetical protein
MRWKRVLYYAGHVFRVCASAVPFVFFCTQFERLFRAILAIVRLSLPQATAMPMSQNQASSSSSVITQTMPSPDIWYIGMLLVCVTILLISSMVLIGRAVHRD